MKNQYFPDKVFRFCPRCGSEGFEPESAKSLKCTKCGFRYFINPVAAVAALIFNTGGQLLLTRRRHNPAAGMLDLPGGFIDVGETAEEALIREIKEELNVTIDSFKFYGTFPNEYLFGGIVYFTLDIVFNCQVSNLNTLGPADDVLSCEFISPAKINLDLIGLNSVKSIIQSYLNSAKTGFFPA
jgi:NAD+ diphosphatase